MTAATGVSLGMLLHSTSVPSRSSIHAASAPNVKHSLCSHAFMSSQTPEKRVSSGTVSACSTEPCLTMRRVVIRRRSRSRSDTDLGR